MWHVPEPVEGEPALFVVDGTAQRSTAVDETCTAEARFPGDQLHAEAVGRVDDLDRKSITAAASTLAVRATRLTVALRRAARTAPLPLPAQDTRPPGSSPTIDLTLDSRRRRGS